MIFQSGRWIAGFYTENNVPYLCTLKIDIRSGCVLAAFSGVSQKQTAHGIIVIRSGCVLAAFSGVSQKQTAHGMIRTLNSELQIAYTMHVATG